MTVSGPGDSGRIFISYRRQDADWPATWLFDRFAEHFGAERVFRDVDSIRPGDDFVAAITAAVESCDVLLAVIGGRWLTITGEDGRRRLDDPADFVRLEVEVALTRDVRVIPILVEGARMPRADQLPESLRKLTHRQALELVPSRFKADCLRLLGVLDDVLTSTPGATGEPSPPGGSPAKLDAAGADAGDVGQTAAGADPAGSQAGAAGVAGQSQARLPARVIRSLTGHKAGYGNAITDFGVLGVAFRPDGSLLASAGADATVRLWDVATGKEKSKLPGLGSAIRCVAFSPDGNLLALGGNDAVRLQLFELATGTMTKRLAGHSLSVRAVAFSPDGALLASGGADKVTRLWEVATWTEPRNLGVDSGTVRAVAFSPDGALLASGGDGRAVALWKVATGEKVRVLAGHTLELRGVAFSPNGALLASASDDQTVRVWEVATGKEVHKLIGHTGWVRGVAFSPDGSVLASASGDRTVRLWEVATGKQVGRLTGHGGWVHCVAFSPDGALLASGSGDKTIRLWGPDAGPS